MGRVFTIKFNFEEKAMQALVCMYEKGYSINFKIHVFNEELYSFLPSGDFEFSFTDGLRKPTDLKDKKSRELIHCITEEISHFLDIEEQNRWQVG